LPFAQDACDELQLELELNGALVLEKIDSTIVIPIGTTQFDTLLPTDMLEPQRLSERLSGSTDLFVNMTTRMWEPEILPTDSLRYWAFREGDIFTPGATTTRDVKIYYLKRMFNITTISDSISVNGSRQFLINRIAALAAKFIGQNESRSNELNLTASEMLNKLTRINAKSKQRTRTRRRPFRLIGRKRWV
jgi:hypothetical protein